MERARKFQWIYQLKKDSTKSGLLTLTWWWSLWGSVTFRAMPAGTFCPWQVQPCRFGREVESRQRITRPFLPVVGWAWGQSPLLVKILQITETLISRLNECYLGNSTTTCRTPEDEYIRWVDGGMTDTRPIRKEACTLIKSLANPKKTLRIGNWNVRTLYSMGKTAQVWLRNLAND